MLLNLAGRHYTWISSGAIWVPYIRPPLADRNKRLKMHISFQFRVSENGSNFFKVQSHVQMHQEPKNGNDLQFPFESSRNDFRKDLFSSTFLQHLFHFFGNQIKYLYFVINQITQYVCNNHFFLPFLHSFLEIKQFFVFYYSGSYKT